MPFSFLVKDALARIYRRVCACRGRHAAFRKKKTKNSGIKHQKTVQIISILHHLLAESSAIHLGRFASMSMFQKSGTPGRQKWEQSMRYLLLRNVSVFGCVSVCLFYIRR